jgi:hypothetical protein
MTPDLRTPPAEPAEVAAHVGAMAGELAALARAAGLAFLAHLLDMARLEAAGCSPDQKDGDPQ